jgi:hypothetical protein
VAAEAANAWYRREARPDGRLWQARCFFDDRFDDGYVVAPDEDPGDLTDTLEIWNTRLDDSGRLVVTVNDWAAPGAPDLWYVSMVRPGDERPTATLVAFATGDFTPGTVITDTEFLPIPVRTDAQVGAIRWWSDEACVEQVYVNPDLRRAHAATKIIYVASAFHQAHDWAGRLHSDDRRTELGQQLVVGLRHANRMAPWGRHMAPMDPEP